MAGARSTEGELKLYGLAAEAARNLRGAAADAWWLAWPPDKAVVFTLHIGQAAFAGWDINRSLMTVHRWSPRSGCSAAPRAHDDHPRAAAAPSSSREYAQG